mmetsp:Transcript_45717/g.126797  ORF Transcript_45717/g.126797 Transcript_45717/m.126797 type:complete len:386 (-) Transcript_45717:340-1497(-)
MFVRYDDEKPQFMQACLTGVQGTPYESGCFMFDIYMPDTYPQTNCLVTHVTKNASMVSANNGPGGFSPNLHRDTGKVCLSLLGTWNGPGWEAGKSNVYQVLSSILWMILGAEHPYYMEPSYGGWEGTAPQSNHVPEVKVYDEAVYFGTAKWAILEQMKTPPVGFEEVVMAHFREKKKVIMNCVQVWHDKGTDGLKTKLAPVIEELAAEFAKLMTVEDAQQELSEAQLEVNFILEKIQYLEAKVKAAGKDAKLKVPKAYRRLKMGPQLLEQAQDRVKVRNPAARMQAQARADRAPELIARPSTSPSASPSASPNSHLPNLLPTRARPACTRPNRSSWRRWRRKLWKKPRPRRLRTTTVPPRTSRVPVGSRRLRPTGGRGGATRPGQ